MSETDPIIQLRSISRVFRTGAGETQGLRGIDMEIYEGEFIALTGPSGSGKSTLLGILGLLDRATGGEYYLDNVCVNRLPNSEYGRIRNLHFGFIFQAFNLIDTLTVLDNVALPLKFRGEKKASRRGKAEEILTAFGLSSRAFHFPNQLSGGEQQRVAICRAVVGKPAIVLADEPTGNLDSENSAKVMSLLQDLNRGGTTVCLVTHNIREAETAHRQIYLKDGMNHADG